jgi:hypothetical protein
MVLAKAKLAVMSEVGENFDEEKDVQFNPATLRLQITNSIEGAKQQGRQVRQAVGQSSNTLTMDLIFDTADEGTTEEPVSVRARTAIVERFLEARESAGGKKAPPRVRFTWHDLIFIGVIDSLTIEMEHFAANGAPLRAKATVTIKEQNPNRELKPKQKDKPPVPGQASLAAPGLGAAAGLAGGISASLSAGAGLGLGASLSGGLTLGASASVGMSLGGESAAEFAARVGMDPAAWRGIDFGGESSLSLSAGAEIGFNAGLSASAGLGVTVGVEASAGISIESSFGLEFSAGASTGIGAGVAAALSSGFALSAAGGVGAALESAQSAKNNAAASAAVQSFSAPARPASSPAPATLKSGSPATANWGRAAAQQARALPDQARAPLKLGGLPSIREQRAAPPAPAPPRADPRASSFGFGAPLRDTTGLAARERATTVVGSAPLRSVTNSGEPPMTEDPTVPPWRELPARHDSSLGARAKSPSASCACGC